MKRLGSNRNLARKKYSHHPHVERSGIGTRQLTEAEIAEWHERIDDIRNGNVMRPIRLPATRGLQ